jgi:hypothetical protein
LANDDNEYQPMVMEGEDVKLLKFDAAAGPYAMRALMTVGRAAAGGFGRPQRAFLDAVQIYTLQAAVNLDELAPVTPAELASLCRDRGQALQLIRFMVVACLANGAPNTEQISLVSAYAAALAVEEPALRVIRYLAQGRVWWFRLAFLRRSHLRYYFRNTYRISGGRVLEVIKAVLIFRGVVKEDLRLVSRYRALQQLPEGSLGRQFFDHLTRASLPFPGEHGGLPEGSIYHDFAHVLAGFDTSPEGEMQAAAFQAGFTEGEYDFFTWLFSIVLHTAGIKLVPLPMQFRPGRIGEGSVAMDVLAALERGGQLKADLGNDWHFWNDVELPLEIVRERFGVPPIAEPLDHVGEPKAGIVPRSAETVDQRHRITA